MKPFPTVVAGIFVAFALFAVAIFATYSAGRGNAVGEVLIWGSLPDRAMREVVSVIQTNDTSFDGVQYQFVNEKELIPNLIAAIAAGKGPDLVIFPAGSLISERDKLIVTPYSSYSRRDFQSTFVEAGEVFLGGRGVYGFPFLIDPLVMYWNRSMFSEAGIGTPPKYWDEVATHATKLSRADDRGTLSQSMVALGTWDNISHAKAIFVTLLRQLGNPVVVETEKGYVSVLSGETGSAPTADSALRFYSDFSDPVKSMYSWNSSQSDSRGSFIAGKLAIYLGRASELAGIRQSNPNLNFDVAVVPSIRGGEARGEAKVLALAIPRGSRNQVGALSVAIALTDVPAQEMLQTQLSLPSVRRDTVAVAPNNPYLGTFRSAALSSFSFLDPDPGASDSIFKRMVQAVTSGSREIFESIRSAESELTALIGVQ